MDPWVRKRASETPTPATVSSASASGLPFDLLQEASQRLGWAALIYSATFFLAYFGAHFWAEGTGVSALPENPSLFAPDRLVQTTVAIVSVSLGLAVFGLSRHSGIQPQTLLDIGLVFEVVGAFGISMSTFWGFWPSFEGEFISQFMGIPWECVWIILFPLLAPNTPGKTLLASLAAASTSLITIALSKSAGLTDPRVPMDLVFGYFLFSTYLCAGLAFVISRAVYRFGRQYGKLLEVGSYRLVRPLGEGGMGEVWVARHRMLARPAAVKLIRPETLGSDEKSRWTLIRRFEREAQATAALTSPHTITLYDYGVTEEGAFYYVMELLRGLNLDQLVKRFGPQTAGRCVHLLRQVCRSLMEAHANGLIHRDIKPANIYTCRLGADYDVVKVLDFGLVKAARDGGAGATELTAEGVTTGTPAFMAPEMALGKADVDERVDIYGIGCVGYWLLTGRRVFEAENALAMAVAHVQETPVPPSQRTELDIPRQLEQVLLACLEKSPRERPDSVAALDARLAECGVTDEWRDQDAREWWSLHLPDEEFEALYAADDEASPQELFKAER